MPRRVSVKIFLRQFVGVLSSFALSSKLALALNWVEHPVSKLLMEFSELRKVCMARLAHSELAQVEVMASSLAESKAGESTLRMS
jgi:hypothetical protein